MTKLVGAQLHHVPGWVGPLIEDAEPDQNEDRGGVLDDGLNLVATPVRTRDVRGGSSVTVSYSAVAGNPITDVLGIWPYAPSGAVVVGHAAAGSKHYAYLHTESLGWKIGSEAASRVDVGWNTATPARPQASELFEKLYIADTRAFSARQGMAVLVYAGGTWTASIPVYDMDGSGATTAALKASCVEAFNSVLFAAGYDTESAPASGEAPHLLRHSLLGTDPASGGVGGTGFDPAAWTIIGAKGQPIRAMKAGRTVLLVAKESELYAISGQGRGLPGWQYQIQQINTTVAIGATNAYALDHALGTWYGVGRAGPWRCDGSNVDLLNIGRDRSWSLIDKTELAFVRYHPDRNHVLFGLYRTGLGAAYAAVPTDFWVWDVDRDQWDVTSRYPRSYHFANTVARASGAPSGVPTALTQSFLEADYSDIGFTVTWTAGDFFAATEVWVRTSSGTSALQFTVNKGIQRATVGLATGFNPDRKICYLKVRHTKDGVAGDFTAEQTVYPALWRPTVYINSAYNHNPHKIAMQAQLEVGLTTGSVYGSSTGTSPYAKTWTGNLDAQQSDTHVGEFTELYYSFYQERLDWAVGRTSGPVQELVTGPPNGVAPTPGAPRQQLVTGLAPTSIVVQWMENLSSTDYYVEYRVYGSGSGYTDAIGKTTSAAVVADLSHHDTTIAGLTAGTAYDVRIRSGANVSNVPKMFTKLASPAITATTNGSAGNPVVDCAVTMPVSGKTLRLYNAIKSYDQTFAGHAVGPTTHTSNVGVGGTGDKYYAVLYDSTWPSGFQYSDPATDEVTDPETVGS